MCALSDIMERSLRGKTVGDRYQLVSPVGQGGFGEVWRAQDLRTGDIVALKMPQHQFALSPNVVESLKSECEVLKTLSHPNICHLLDFENDPNYGPILITEYVEGVDLLKASKGLRFEELIGVFVGVLHGLSYLHGRQIMHLDLKPANILVGPAGPRLIDFGLASFTSPEHFAGTLPYVAPETLLHNNRRLSADLYSLGIVMYECLTRINPFRCDDPDETRKLQKEWTPPPPTKHRDGIPEWFAGLIMLMLEKDPEKRCTISDILKAIRVARNTSSQADMAHIQSFAAASGKFMGRGDIVQRIRASFETNGAPQIRRTIIEGAAGMGKTRLLNEIKLDARISGLQTIVLESAAAVTPATLAPIAEALSSAQPPVLLMIDDFDKWSDHAPALRALLETLRAHPHPPTRIDCIMAVTARGGEAPDIVLQPFTTAEVSDYLAAVAPIPDGPRMALAQQLHAQTGGNPRRLAQLMERMVARNYFASECGQWDESLFEDVTVEISEVFSKEAPALPPDTLAEICKKERRDGHAATALERIIRHSGGYNEQLWVEAAECALACGRVKDALQLMEQEGCSHDGGVLFWKGILLTARQRRNDARSTLQMAHEIALANGDEVLDIRIANQLARCDLLDGDHDAAIDAYRASDARAGELPEAQSRQIINNELGYALLMKGAHGEALPILQDYARRCEAAHHVRRHLNAIVQIGDCQAWMDDHENAASTYARAIFKAREAQQIDILSHAYNQLGKLQFEHAIVNEAMATLKRAIAINHMIGDLSAVAVNTTNLGLSQLRAGLRGDAKVNLEIARAFLVRCPDGVQRTLVPCLIGLAEIASQERQQNKGAILLNEAETLANHHNIYSEYEAPILSIREAIAGKTTTDSS